MAQERFWNWRDDDLTFRLDQWLLGIHGSGVYRGFDADLVDGTNLVLSHTNSGYTKTLKNKQVTDPLGIYITKQGVLIVEDEPITLPIAPNSGANTRIDYIVAHHEYLDIDGGIDSIYKVVQGDAEGNEPSIEEPAIEILLGKLTLPSGTTSLSQAGVVYTRSETPDFSGINRYVRKIDGIIESNLNANNFKITNLEDPTDEQDAATKGYVLSQAVPNASTSERGKVELATNEEAQNGVDSDRAVTPTSLKSVTATDTRAGLIELATNSEAVLGASNLLGISPATLLYVLTNGNYVQDDNYVHTDNNLTALLLAKLASIEQNAQVNKQADWEQADPVEDSYIKNKDVVPNDVHIIGSTLYLRRDTTDISSTELPSTSETKVTYGMLTTTNRQSGVNAVDMFNDFTKNVAYVYPPTGYDIYDLKGIIPSIASIDFSGNVDGNDSLYCRAQVQYTQNRIACIAQNTENRAESRINYMAIWAK